MKNKSKKKIYDKTFFVCICLAGQKCFLSNEMKWKNSLANAYVNNKLHNNFY